MTRSESSSTGCSGFRAWQRMTRREALRIGGLGGAGLTLPELFRARDAVAADGTRPTFGRAKTVIMMFLHGGHPQQETFDPKPDTSLATASRMERPESPSGSLKSTARRQFPFPSLSWRPPGPLKTTTRFSRSAAPEAPKDSAHLRKRRPVSSVHLGAAPSNGIEGTPRSTPGRAARP